MDGASTPKKKRSRRGKASKPPKRGLDKKPLRYTHIKGLYRKWTSRDKTSRKRIGYGALDLIARNILYTIEGLLKWTMDNMGGRKTLIAADLDQKYIPTNKRLVN